MSETMTFCEEITIYHKEMTLWFEAVLAPDARNNDGMCLTEAERHSLIKLGVDVMAIDESLYPGFEHEFSADYEVLQLFSNGENFNVDNIVIIMQAFLKRFSGKSYRKGKGKVTVPTVWSMTWGYGTEERTANYASGGFAVVTADRIILKHAHQLRDEVLDKLKETEGLIKEAGKCGVKLTKTQKKSLTNHIK